MFIPFFLTSPGPVALTPRGHLIPPTVSLEPFPIHTLNLLWAMVSLREGPAPQALFPLPGACTQDTACLLLLPNLLLTLILLTLPITLIHSLVRQLLQHMRFLLPCLLKPSTSTYSPLQGKYLHNRARLIPLLLKEGGEAIQTNLPLLPVDPVLVSTPTLPTSNRALSPSRIGRFAQISLVRVAVFMDITPTIVPSYPRCGRCGSLKPHCMNSTPPLMLLLMWPLPSQLCLLILSLSKDLWLPNRLTARSPLPLPFLVPPITKSL